MQSAIRLLDLCPTALHLPLCCSCSRWNLWEAVRDPRRIGEVFLMAPYLRSTPRHVPCSASRRSPSKAAGPFALPLPYIPHVFPSQVPHSAIAALRRFQQRPEFVLNEQIRKQLPISLAGRILDIRGAECLTHPLRAAQRASSTVWEKL